MFRRISSSVVVVALLFSGWCMANEVQAPAVQAESVEIPSLSVKERLVAIEQINVSSQKDAQPLDDVELREIIDAALELEIELESEQSESIEAE